MEMMTVPYSLTTLLNNTVQELCILDESTDTRLNDVKKMKLML